MVNNIDDELLTPKEVSKILRLSYGSTLRLIRENIFYIRVGKSIRVSKKELYEYIKSK